MPGGGPLMGIPGGGPPGGTPPIGGLGGGGPLIGAPMAPPGGPGIEPGIDTGGVCCGGAPAGAPLPCGVMSCAAGPPTPLTGPASPGGAAIVGAKGAGTPRPAARPIPAPGAALAPTSLDLASLDGGPSTVKETRCSPRNKTKPSTLFSSRSGALLLFGLIFLNSSQSPKMMFMCLSKAKKVPIKLRPSCNVHRIR